MNIYTIYENPSDYPGKFIVRLIIIKSATPEISDKPYAIELTLEDARAKLPSGLINVGRSPCDDSVIVESWL